VAGWSERLGKARPAAGALPIAAVAGLEKRPIQAAVPPEIHALVPWVEDGAEICDAVRASFSFVDNAD
jgi:hypothetical protein